MATDAFAKSADYADWHSKDTVVTPDNVAAAKIRYEASEAMIAGTATQAQRELIEKTDADMQRILAAK